MSKLAKFFIICGAVCVLGIGLFAAGIATGGVDDIDKVATKYDWMSGNPGPIQTEVKSTLEFNSIDIDGATDVMIAGPEYWQEAEEMAEHGDGALLETAGAGDVVIRYGEKIQKPDVMVKEGVLTIYTHKYEDGGVINMNFTDEDGTPDIIVFCSNTKLDSIHANNPWGDITINGVNVGSVDISTDSGDAELITTSCDKLNIQSEDGDVDLNGTFGETIITTSDGDVDFETSVNSYKYSIDIYAQDGDVTDGENDNIGSSYKKDGGENLLKIRTYNGDVDLWFGDTLF